MAETTLTDAEFVILSLICEQPLHGYEIENQINLRNMRAWTDPVNLAPALIDCQWQSEDALIEIHGRREIPIIEKGYRQFVACFWPHYNALVHP